MLAYAVPYTSRSRYTKAWVAHGVKNTKDTFPWIDGINLDLEHFPRKDTEKQALVAMVCEMQTQLNAAGLRLHSMDLAPWGSWGVFNVTALAECMDYIVPMAYCSPQSTTVAGPTLPLDAFKDMVKGGTTKHSKLNPDGVGWSRVAADKVIVGLPAFGYSFPCTNPQPVAFPRNNTCFMEQPAAFPFVQFSQVMQLWRGEQIISGSQILYDDEKAAAWFEFKNKTTGRRHQVWYDDHRSVKEKAQWVWKSGFAGLSFWTADALYSGQSSADSAEARAMWAATQSINSDDDTLAADQYLPLLKADEHREHNKS